MSFSIKWLAIIWYSNERIKQEYTTRHWTWILGIWLKTKYDGLGISKLCWNVRLGLLGNQKILIHYNRRTIFIHSHYLYFHGYIDILITCLSTNSQTTCSFADIIRGLLMKLRGFWIWHHTVAIPLETKTNRFTGNKKRLFTNFKRLHD